METYIALILFILPGYLARKIARDFLDTQPVINTFELTVSALLYDICIFPGAYFLTWLRFPDIALFRYTDFFSSTDRIVWLATATILTAVFAGFIVPWIQRLYISMLNRIRTRQGQTIVTPNMTTFDSIFNDGEIHWVEVYQDKKLIARGILDQSYADMQELYVENNDELLPAYMDTVGKIKRYKGTYIDYKHHLIIKEIDTSA